jgi:hypothetical protein
MKQALAGSKVKECDSYQDRGGIVQQAANRHDARRGFPAATVLPQPLCAIKTTHNQKGYKNGNSCNNNKFL